MERSRVCGCAWKPAPIQNRIGFAEPGTGFEGTLSIGSKDRAGWCGSDRLESASRAPFLSAGAGAARITSWQVWRRLAPETRTCCSCMRLPPRSASGARPAFAIPPFCSPAAKDAHRRLSPSCGRPAGRGRRIRGPAGCPAAAGYCWKLRGAGRGGRPGRAGSALRKRFGLAAIGGRSYGFRVLDARPKPAKVYKADERSRCSILGR